MSVDSRGRTVRQRLVLLAGLLAVVGAVVGGLALIGALGTNNDVEAVELLDTPASESSSVTDVGPTEGKLAPDFEISDFNNERHRLSDLRGQAVYINFWATWCSPCKEEMPDIEKLAEEYGDDLVVVVVNRRQTVSAARSFLEDEVPNLQGGYGVDFELETIDPDDTLYEAYRGLGMPTSIFVAPDGVVAARADGRIDLDEMRAFIDEALIGVLGTNNDVEAVELLDTPASEQSGVTDVGPSEGKLAPDFEISDVDNKRHRLSDLRGGVVYINFWATWCVPCQKELPEIEQLQEEYGDDLTVIVVNRREPLSRVRDFLDGVPDLQGDKGVEFDINGLDTDDTLYEAYRGLGMPTSIFVDPDGVVAARADGLIELDQMRANIDAALATP